MDVRRHDKTASSVGGIHAVIYAVEIRRPEEGLERKRVARVSDNIGSESKKREPVKKGVKIGRNDPCPCGSGKKYKLCHGRDRE